MEARTVYTREVFSFHAAPLAPALPPRGAGAYAMPCIITCT